MGRMAETTANINPDDKKQLPLAEEKKALDLALERITSELNEKALENLDPQTLDQQLSDIRSKLEQHKTRFDQKLADTLEILLDRSTTSVKIERVKLLLGEDFSTVIQITLTDENAWVRLVSAEALVDTKDPECLRALRDGLKDLSYDVRTACLNALKRTDDPECLKVLREGLTDTSWEVRQVCATGLNRTNDPASLEALKYMAGYDLHPDVRFTASSILREVK